MWTREPGDPTACKGCDRALCESCRGQPDPQCSPERFMHTWLSEQSPTAMAQGSLLPFTVSSADTKDLKLCKVKWAEHSGSSSNKVLHLWRRLLKYLKVIKVNGTVYSLEYVAKCEEAYTRASLFLPHCNCWKWCRHLNDPDYSLLDENFSVPHNKRGVLGMVNKGHHTNGSQFYITLQATPYLDKKYVAFGYVCYRF